MEQNKLPKNIRQIGEKEDWIRVYMEDYVHTYIQRLRGLQESGISGGVLLGKKQRINGVMHLFIRGAAVVEDPFWRTPGQTPGQMQAESSVYFPGLEICGFFVSSRQNRSSEVELVRIFETHFSSEYQVLFNVRDQDEEVFSYSGHGLLKLAGYYIYYEKNEPMHEYLVEENSRKACEKKEEKPDVAVASFRKLLKEKQANHAKRKKMVVSYGMKVSIALVLFVGAVTLKNQSEKIRTMEAQMFRMSESEPIQAVSGTDVIVEELPGAVQEIPPEELVEEPVEIPVTEVQELEEVTEATEAAPESEETP